MNKAKIIAAALFVFFSLFASQVLRADEGMKEGARTENKATGASRAGDESQARSQTAPVTPMKMSAMTGAAVKNLEGQQLGTVEDLVVGKDSRIQYMILSHGGVLNIGDRLFAVPWDAVKPGREPNTFVVDIDRERLANAPNFERNTWPNFADPNVYNLNYGYYMTESDKDRAKEQRQDAERKTENRSE